MKSHKFNLKAYSAASIAFLSLHGNANAQAEYIDIDPDVILDTPGQIFGIDLDDDGLNDFNFFNKSYTTTVFYDDIANVKALFVGAFDTMQNGVMGSTGYLSGFGGYTYYWPYALPNGQLINNTGNFYNANYQTLAKEIYKFPNAGPGTSTQLGKWYPWGGEDVLDHYLGIRFTDEEDVRRYGWIRCSVIDSGRTLIIKDYAYESKPDVGIIAGDTIGDTTTVNIEEQLSNQIHIYSSGKNITVQLATENNYSFKVFNIRGEEVFSSDLFSTQTFYLPEVTAGVYVVTVKNEDEMVTKKVMIE